MRLLDARTLELKTFVDNIPPYAILSHCWEDEEVVFSDLADLGQARKKKGFTKLEKTCQLSVGDRLDYAWIDTCCIDKSSSAELSEAINSMFAWYRNSEKCYAYLADVELPDSLPLSRWFTRAWTLQELLAPNILHVGRLRDRIHGAFEGIRFYSRDWVYIGSKVSLGVRISEITDIPLEYLQTQTLESASISMRMSWAADRQATRAEDIAYSLLGLFGVNMPLLYGEGKIKAFKRLQEEIMKISDDETIFAWEGSDFCTHEVTGDALARSPNDFREASHLIPFAADNPVAPYAITHRGLCIWQATLLTHLDDTKSYKLRPLRSPVMIWSGLSMVTWGILRCHPIHDFEHFVVIPLRHLSANIYRRDTNTSVCLIPCESVQSEYSPKEIYIHNSRTSTISTSVRRRWGFLLRKPPETMEIRRCYPEAAWNVKDRILQGNETIEDNDGSSSWHATLELSIGSTNESEGIERLSIFVALGCNYSAKKPPEPWCRVHETGLHDPKSERKTLETFHYTLSPQPSWSQTDRFGRNDVIYRKYVRKVNGVGPDLSISVTQKKVLSQDMFVVNWYDTKLPVFLYSHYPMPQSRYGSKLFPSNTS